MLIEGYDGGPLVAGVPLPARSGFWPNHLRGQCCRTGDAEPEWFGDDGRHVDATSEALLDRQRWPVFRVPVEGGYGLVVVYRNCVDDYGADYLMTSPGRGHAQHITSRHGDLEGEPPRWRELIRVAGSRGAAAEGIEDPAARLFPLLPLLVEPALPGEGDDDALIAVGAPQDTAPRTARRLLEHSEGKTWHDPAWGSPLSGGSAASTPPGSGLMARPGIA
ncbi:hypothetical protein [Streptomyces achromogenes]|uniref:hypothetical protein n=1 Tax=Streptomyces achromogenes TaxID=67255 RepID=UPI0037136636